MEATDPNAWQAAFEHARAAHARHLLIEGAGLFWLGAELFILLGVTAGRRHLEHTPTAARFAWDRAMTRNLFLAAAALVFCALIAYGRHWTSPPAHAWMLANPDGAAEAAAAVYRAKLLEHFAVWAGFVVGWVALEAAIVYHGWRGYLRLRPLLGGHS